MKQNFFNFQSREIEKSKQIKKSTGSTPLPSTYNLISQSTLLELVFSLRQITLRVLFLIDSGI